MRANRAAFAVLVAIAAAVLTGAAFATPWKLFVSKRYGYSMRYPSSWRAARAKTNINVHGGVPTVDSPSLDAFTLRAKDFNVRVAAQPVAAGTTLDDWTGAEARSIKDGYGCAVDSREELTVGGEDGTLLMYHSCPGWENLYFLFIAVVHGDRGYQIYWLSPHRVNREQPERALFLRFVKTFQFRG